MRWIDFGRALNWGSHHTSNANFSVKRFDAETEQRDGKENWLSLKLKQAQEHVVAGFGGAADGKAGKSTKKPQLNFQKWFNQAIYSHKTGRLREAEVIYKKMISAGTSDPAVFCNLGIICKNSGRINEALEHYEQALEFEPEDSNGTSLRNWGEFESNNPSTFQSMYQFWAYKPL